jgi:hypothetical protein
MNDDSQLIIPDSFIELYLSRGRTRPNESRDIIAGRYDLCEDMAQMLTEHARTTLFELGINEQLVLDRMHRGLLADGSGVSKDEAGWIACRLAELLSWPRLEIARDQC